MIDEFTFTFEGVTYREKEDGGSWYSLYKTVDGLYYFKYGVGAFSAANSGRGHILFNPGAGRFVRSLEEGLER